MKLTYTSQDIRYTCKGNSVYAFILGSVMDQKVILESLSISEDQNNLKFHGIIEEVVLLGYGSVEFSHEMSGLEVSIPEDLRGNDLPLGIQIKLK